MRRQFSIFAIIFIFEALLIQMTFFSNNNDTRTAFYYSLESFTQCASNESNFISLRHSVQVLPSDEKGHVYRNQAISASNFIFSNYFNFQSLYVKIFPIAKTDRMIAFCYFLESLAQCASKEFSPIALRYSVQVLSSDETGHVGLVGRI